MLLMHLCLGKINFFWPMQAGKDGSGVKSVLIDGVDCLMVLIDGLTV